MAEGTRVVTERKGRVGVITFDGPERLNALRPETMGALSAAVASLEEDEGVGAVLVTGRGEAFSAGGDLDFVGELRRMPAVEVKRTVYADFQGAVRRVKLCPKPTLAAVHGPAVGAGCELAIACDFRVVTPEALFYESWRDLGLIPPLGGMFLLPRLVGLAKATEMILLGEKVSGEEAGRIGLANKVVPREALEGEAMALAERLADGPPLAYAAAKEGLRRGMDSTLAAEWEASVYAQAMLFGTRDFAEAAEAFREKRRPAFRGE